MWGNSGKKTKTIDEAADELIDVLKNTNEYVQYISAKQPVENDEECIGKIREYRKLNAEIQNMSDNDRINHADNIERRMEEITGDSRVLEYVQAELDFARVFQKIMKKVTDSIDLIE